MSELPDTLARDRHLDLAGRSRGVWARRAALAGLVGVLAAALAGVFGQSERTTTAGGTAASLTLRAPAALRSGLIYQARFVVRAARPVERPVLVLEGGWLDGMTVNTVEPAPVEETERDGFLALGYPALAAGASMTVHVQLQVNPTTIGRRQQAVLLRDDGRVLARIERSIVVFP